MLSLIRQGDVEYRILTCPTVWEVERPAVRSSSPVMYALLPGGTLPELPVP